MPKSAELHIDILADAQKAIGAFQDLQKKSTTGMDMVKGAVLGASGAILGEFTEASKKAMEHQVQVAKVAQEYTNLGLPVGDVNKAMEEIDASARKTGLSADDSVEAYGRLMVATKDSGKAMEELGTAQDLAALKGTSVTTAASAITRAQEGNTRALKELGIATVDQYGKALSAEEVMKKLTEAVHGQADAYGKTAAGEMARFHESLDQIQVTIGNALLPAIQGFLDLLQPLLGFLNSNTAVTKILVPVLAALGGAIVGISVGVKVWTVAQTALNVVLDANPIGLVIVAVAALVVGVIYAYNSFKPFRDVVQWVWDALKGLGDWVMGHWKLILGVMLGPLGALILNFGTVKDLVADLLGWLGKLGAVTFGGVESAIRAVLGLLQKVADAAKTAFGWIGKVGSFGSGVLSHIPGLGGLSAPAPAAGAVAYVAVYVTPGDNFAEAVYRGLREYQRRHARPELRDLFGG